jgi:Flp pilus assembly protein TadB
VHAVKAGVRPVVTASTGGVGNPIVSAGEDGVAIGLSVIALVAPILIVLVLAAQSALIVYLLRERRRRRRERHRSQPQL